MELEYQINVSRCAHLISRIEGFIRDKNVNSALQLYLSHYSEMTTKSSLEWKLVILCQEVNNFSFYPSNWPEDLLKRLSGAFLVFVTSQLTNNNIPFSHSLKKLSKVPTGIKTILASAWAKYPMSQDLDNLVFRKKFVQWLTEENDAIAPTLLAVTKLNDQEHLNLLGKLWLKRGLNSQKTPEYVHIFCQYEQLKAFTLQGIQNSLALFFENTNTSIQLMQAAFKLGKFDGIAYEIVVSYSEILLLKDLTSEQTFIVSSLRLSALSDIGNHEQQIVQEYKIYWQSQNWHYPYPEKLLYVFHLLGKNELEEHLLKNSTFTNETPQWVILWRDCVLKTRSSQQIFSDWENFYYKTQNLDEEHTLVGFTHAFLDLPVKSKEWYERLYSLWQYLSSVEDYDSNLAKSFMVLLQTMDDDIISEFEQLLLNAPLIHRFVRESAYAYVSALRRTKKYDKLTRYLEQPISSGLRLTAPFEEYHFSKIMGELAETLPETEDDLYNWFDLWKKLFGLPISSEMLLEALVHFDNLRNALKNNEQLSQLIFNDGVDRDLYLQIRRRAKAEAERLLSEKKEELASDKFNEMKRALHHVDITGVRSILGQLI